jgi:hypothetical protein
VPEGEPEPPQLRLEPGTAHATPEGGQQALLVQVFQAPHPFHPHSAPASALSRIFFSARILWVIYLQNWVVDHVEYSISLG